MKVNFNQPIKFNETLQYLNEAIENHHLSGMGPFTKKCEFLLSEKLGSPNLMVTSATHALEMMAILLDIQPGDEVILPSFTFVSTANAFVLRGAKLRFADNDDYGNISLSEVERLMTNKTKAVMAVHYAGNSANMEKLLQICKKAGVALVEDAAQAIGSTFMGQALGTFGTLGCLSFHETKNVSAGEGGSLICNDSALIERAEIIREKGTNRRKFVQGMADKYTWVDIGSSYVLSDLNCAYLFPQLLKLNQINERRKEIWTRYEAELESAFAKVDAKVLKTPIHNNTPNAHLFAVILPSLKLRSSFIEFMLKSEIICPFHYVSLHSSPYGLRSSAAKVESLPNCEYFSSGLVRFPLFFDLSEEQQDYVIAQAKKWIGQQ